MYAEAVCARALPASDMLRPDGKRNLLGVAKLHVALNWFD
jgi:hypothetical protein